MRVSASIFFDINLPNAPTWFYFSALLAVALFFKFSRLLSIRNLDVLTLFLPMPGFLLIIESERHALWGYVWLLGASLYFLVRCFIDLALVRRPALSSNLDLAGLAWLGGALFLSLVAVAVRQPNQREPSARAKPASPADIIRQSSEKGVQLSAPDVDADRLRFAVVCALALLCHLSVVVGLVLIGWRQFEDVHAGMAAATFYLLLPYTYLLLPGSTSKLDRWDHAWPMALMVWAVFAYRRPTLAGAFLGVAAGTAFFPVVTVPAWLGFYRKAGATRFVVSFAVSAVVCLAVLGCVLWVNGELPSSLRSAWTGSDWQPWKEPHSGTSGVWEGVPWPYRMPLFLLSAALVLATAFWPSPKDLAHVLALSAAVLLSIQFWFADRGGTYVLWYLPFLLLLVFRPNLSAAVPAPPPRDDWLARLGRRLGRAWVRLRRRFRLRRRAEPAVPPA
jgi:hypothetical protein